ncbi:rhomboid family intramembrane serine protease [Aliikangiella maris]|uniref:Rhomboid family intramembrane serine protease n=2 Tax=Aliikangiella maris TaxID=3162458 RepID=A0ABV2BW13_9GAMM
MSNVITKNYQFILFLVAIMWLLEVINIVIGRQFNQYALVPRNLESLPGIFTMHFLHWNLTHLISNSIPLLVMGFFVSTLKQAKQVTISIMILAGLMVWMFARPGIHAGASGLVMGYWGYLISSAFFKRNLVNIVVAMVTIFFYGGIVYSLLDFRQHVSFEGHIFGFLAGIISAWFWHKRV